LRAACKRRAHIGEGGGKEEKDERPCGKEREKRKKKKEPWRHGGPGAPPGPRTDVTGQGRMVGKVERKGGRREIRRGCGFCLH